MRRFVTDNNADLSYGFLETERNEVWLRQYSGTAGTAGRGIPDATMTYKCKHTSLFTLMKARRSALPPYSATEPAAGGPRKWATAIYEERDQTALPREKCQLNPHERYALLLQQR
jgi:hypothetical protein